MSDVRDDHVKLNSLRVEALYDHSIIPIAVMLSGALILVFVLWDSNNALPLLSWLTILLLVTTGRFINVRQYRVSGKIPEQYSRWLIRYLFGAILSGMIWGSAAYVFITGFNIVDIGILSMFMLVVVAGSIGIYSIFQSTYYGFNLPAIVPFIFFLLTSKEEILNTFGFVIIIFTGFILVIQYDAHRIINQLLLVKFDNHHLLSGYEKDQRKIRTLETLISIKDIELKKIKTELNNLKKQVEN